MEGLVMGEVVGGGEVEGEGAGEPGCGWRHVIRVCTCWTRGREISVSVNSSTTQTLAQMHTCT